MGLGILATEFVWARALLKKARETIVRKNPLKDTRGSETAGWNSPCQLMGLRVHNQGPKRLRYSPDVIKALTISALMKLPLKLFSFVSQKS